MLHKKTHSFSIHNNVHQMINDSGYCWENSFSNTLINYQIKLEIVMNNGRIRFEKTLCHAIWRDLTFKNDCNPFNVYIRSSERRYQMKGKGVHVYMRLIVLEHKNSNILFLNQIFDCLFCTSVICFVRDLSLFHIW